MPWSSDFKLDVLLSVHILLQNNHTLQIAVTELGTVIPLIQIAVAFSGIFIQIVSPQFSLKIFFFLNYM